MKISFINQSMSGYGASNSTMEFHYEAIERGYETSINDFSEEIDFYIVNMFSDEQEIKLKKHLKPNKYLYLEHSIEQLIFEKPYIREWLMPNAYKNLFFSPRHRQHCEDGHHPKYRNLAIDNVDYIIPNINTDFFKPVKEIKRKEDQYMFAGYIHPNKGINRILNLARRHPNRYYNFFGVSDTSAFDINEFKKYYNVKYWGSKKREEMPYIYSAHQNIILFGDCGAVESFGRVILEGILCGCTAVINEDVGIGSYSWFKKINNDGVSLDEKREEIIKQIKISNDNLFSLIENGIKGE